MGLYLGIQGLKTLAVSSMANLESLAEMTLFLRLISDTWDMPVAIQPVIHYR